MRVKVFPKEYLALYLDVENYTPYSSQGLPRAQKDSMYLVLKEDKWVLLYYIKGKFYLPSQNLVNDYFKWELWQDENTILKGAQLQTINKHYLSDEGYWLKIAYRIWKITRDYKKLFKTFKNESN